MVFALGALISALQALYPEKGGTGLVWFAAGIGTLSFGFFLVSLRSTRIIQFEDHIDVRGYARSRSVQRSDVMTITYIPKRINGLPFRGIAFELVDGARFDLGLASPAWTTMHGGSTVQHAYEGLRTWLVDADTDTRAAERGTSAGST
jgi:hypothetical protein